jgi:outer membrane biosynthesis protein TonB
MTRKATVKWVALALVGLLIAGGVAVAGSRLVSRQIGLSSEPIRAGDALAPPTPAATGKPSKPDTKPKPPAEPAEPPVETAEQPAEAPVEPEAPSTPPTSGGDRHDGDGGDD